MNLIKRLMFAVAMGAALTVAALPASADTKPMIKIGYVEGWDDSVATSNVAATIIEKRLGYPVKLVPVAAGVMWEGVARGDLDATLSAWLPVTQGAYWTRFHEKVVDLGANFTEAKIGLIVPADAKVNSIADLAAQKTAFSGRIVGIDAGAGVMTKTAEAIKAYDIGFQLMPSSGSAMTAELARDINAKRPVVVTGWAPHWMFAKWKLKFLEDPKKVFGEAEHVDNVINPELEKKAPQVVAFLKKFQWKTGQIDGVMLAAQNGAKPQEAATKWVDAHKDQVNEWVSAAQ
ncbi:glycine betaine ABC transporter substrate-binding protein [Trinickia sp. LjRoot230]|uniref:glycine betaine ABC transporter substrate-binding protein n=1 Tax=Trinickia sp. LjRoot230 TaxID=3342288 RepID=UPI003ECC65D7